MYRLPSFYYIVNSIDFNKEHIMSGAVIVSITMLISSVMR